MAPEIDAASTFSSQRALLLALAMSINLGSIAFIVIAPFFPEIADDLDATVPLVGQVTAIRLLVGAALGLLIGPLADAYGHRRIMILGLVAAAITPLGIGLAPSYAMLMLTAIPGGFAAASLTGLTLAVAGSSFSKEMKNRAIGLLSGVQAASGVIVVPILTALGSSIGWRTVFIFCGVVSCLAIIPVALPLPRHAHPTTTLSIRSLLGGYVPLLRDGETVRIYVVIALRSVCWGSLITYYGAYLKEEAGFSGGQVGLAYFFSSIGFFLACILAGRVRFSTPGGRSAIGDLAMGLSVGALFAGSLPTVPLLMVCTATGVGGAFGYVGILGMLAETASRRQVGSGITMSLGIALFSLGSASGGVAGGVLLASGGYPMLGIIVPVFALAGTVLIATRSTRIV